MARAADVHRERAVVVLKRAYADGRLELDELEARVGRALGARSTWDLRLQLRGLVADDVALRARRTARLAGIVAVWALLSVFLAVAAVVALVATHASVWTLAFPAVWVLVTALAARDARRVR